MAGQALFVTGLVDVDRKLAGLEKKMQRSSARKASREAVKVVAEEAKKRVRVASGESRKSIKVRAITRSRKGIGHRVVSGADGSGPAFYGKFLELGWKPRGSSERIARPFLRSALYDSRPRVLAIFRDTLRRELGI